MWRKIFQPLPAGEYELRERMLRSIIQIGGIAVLVGMIEILFLTEDTTVMVPVWVGLFIAIAVTLGLTFKYRKYELAAMILGFIIMIIIFPIMFCVSGGIGSGCPIWLALGLIYIFIMFRGKKLICFLIMTIGTYAGLYYVTFQYPELVTPMSSGQAIYIDSFFSLVIVAFVVGLIFQVHMRVFEEEHKLNLRQKEELKKNSESKDFFFANMSHEIRTPINAIMGFDEMIMRADTSEEVQEYAREIQVASKMLLNQVNDILDLSKMEMGKMPIIPVNYSTKEVLGDLIDLVRVQAEKKGLDFYLDIDKNIPSVLYGDEKRLKQVLLNILDNAVKYTEEGSVTFSVVGEEYKDDKVALKFKIADTGMGIRKENLAGIYDAFNRLDEIQNKKIVGTGLGLAITKQLIELMDGEITVDSIYRKGTIFTVIITQKIIKREPIEEMDYHERKSEEGKIYKPLFKAPDARILLVDDSGMNRMVASKLLTSTKVQIDVATNGFECLELAKKKYYHVILLDAMMPEMDGLTTLKAIRAQQNGLCRDSAIIVMTGNVFSGARQMYLEQGFDGFVEKPMQGKILESEILQFIPTDIIEYRELENLDVRAVNQIQKIGVNKRKKIYVTADCACDIPQELLEKYDIKLMYLYIRTPNGRFADTREIDSDSFAHYISEEGCSAVADSVTVEEYEEFFAEVLTQAERVVHISMGSRVGKSYDIAVKAAEGFDHVRVIDSNHISCGEGLVVLHAAKLAQEGRSADEICAEIDNMKGHVQTRFIIPGAEIFYQSGRTKRIIAKVCKMFDLHPYVAMRQKRVAVVGLLAGSLESAWRQGIRWHLRKKRKINQDVVFITHIGCSVKQQELIVNEVMKCIPFKKVIIQKASFSVACNAGMEAIGISYYSL